jgi:predicted transcriptional regulator
VPIKMRLVDSSRGYTPGMKTAVSVPDDVFQSAERLARRERRSRSEVYSAALREYVARHAPDEITDALDKVLADTGASVDPFVAAAGVRAVDRADW